MKTGLLLAALCALPIAALAHHEPGHGHTGEHAAIQVGQPWAPATPPVATVGAGYATITNPGDQADRLLGGESPAAGRVEIHLMRHDNGVMTMRPLPDGVEIPPGATLELQPGGVHLMFLNLTKPLQAGEIIPVTLEFQDAGLIEAQFTVRPLTGGHGHGDAAQADHNH